MIGSPPITGVVDVIPKGSVCGNGNGTSECTYELEPGTVMRLTSNAPGASTPGVFSLGTGDAAASATSTCTFPLNTNSEVTATFDPSVPTLSVAIALADDAVQRMPDAVCAAFARHAAGQCAGGRTLLVVLRRHRHSRCLRRRRGVYVFAASGAVVLFEASARDRFDGVIPAVCSSAPGSMFPLGTTTKPVVTAPDHIVVQRTSPDGASVGYTVSATDLVDKKRLE